MKQQYKIVWKLLNSIMTWKNVSLVNNVKAIRHLWNTQKAFASYNIVT